MSTEAVPRWSHIGLCVTDLARSMSFYCDGLGCEPAERYELDTDQLPGLGHALEVGERAVIVSQMITHGSLRIELLEWNTPAAEGTPSLRRNQLGLTHLSFWVSDVDAVADRLQRFGGTLLPATRQSPGVELVFLADPDGTRVELMASP
ncbi:MAG: VOC family protein [Acidobacteriota bacterium]|nr:VOC family protein [Acidobacteriota bacterium]